MYRSNMAIAMGGGLAPVWRDENKFHGSNFWNDYL